MNLELVRTGTSTLDGRPGAWWKTGDRFIFTPAPLNSRRFARQTAKSGPVSGSFLIPYQDSGPVTGRRVTRTTEIHTKLPD